MRTLLLDEHSTPSLRSVLGTRLARAERADFAVARIRLAGIDLSSDELGTLRRCRVLVGRLDAAALAESGATVENRAQVEVLHRLFDSGRLEVRAAGLQGWYPDFSVLHEPAGGSSMALVGAHYFARPYPASGPALTCIMTDAGPVAAAAARFDELWAGGYDVSTVVRTALNGDRSARG